MTSPHFGEIVIDIPHQLIDDFAAGDAVAFVGAGLSMGAGLPSWSKLLEPLCDLLESCPAEATFPDIAELYELQTSRAKLIQFLKSQLPTQRLEPTEAHEALLRLELRRIYTTNFDDLLERAAEKMGLEFDLAVGGEDLALLRGGHLQIIKIHGDLAQADTVVLTSEDYASFARKKESLANMLRADLQTRPSLFVGYSFRDENMRLILAQARDGGGSTPRRRYALQPSVTPVIERFWRNKGVLMLAPGTHPRGDGAAVNAWLSSFAGRVGSVRRSRHSNRPAPPPTQQRHNLPPRVATFVGRKGDSENVLDALSSRYPVVTVEGFAGVGKTSLAVEIGHACVMSPNAAAQDIIFDFVVWVSAGEKPDQKEWFEDVLNAIATVTGFPAVCSVSADHLHEKVEHVNWTLRTWPVLVIIDNFETIDDRRLLDWVEAVPEPSKVLITTRNLHLHRKAFHVPVSGLPLAEALPLLRRTAGALGLAQPPADSELARLVEVAAGNPQAMRLALGLVERGTALGEVCTLLEQADPGHGIDAIFDGLFASSWGLMSEPAKLILMSVPLFLGVDTIAGEALIAAAGLGGRAASAGAAVKECVRLGLLEPSSSDDDLRFSIHPLTRSFARTKWDDRPEFEAKARERLIDYFIGFVEHHVVRKEPAAAYWNVLVNDGMNAIDTDWPAILDLMQSCDRTGRLDLVSRLTFLLVHYMDSRFYNEERLQFVKRSIEYAVEIGDRFNEALLRIDALGWTYCEENDLDRAWLEIEAGLRVAEDLGGAGDALIALGRAWAARVRLEQERRDEAEALADDALRPSLPPWIRYRVLVVQGDIKLKSGSGADALRLYQRAAQEAKSYGDEGRGYLILPRVGLAHLAAGNVEGAQRLFESLQSFCEMELTRLYGDLGLAIVAYHRGHGAGAADMVKAVRKKLLQRSRSNLLLKLADELELRLKSGQ
jgi:LuxR family glucitol operon transcriptional activator